MTIPEMSTRKHGHWTDELRIGLIFAGLMLAVPLFAKLAARFGWVGATDFAQRALMTLIAAFLVMTGNSIPKRLSSLSCVKAPAARVQAFNRFAGWTWVITGLALGLSWLLLPLRTASPATLIIVPAGIALIAIRWLALLATRRAAV